MFICNCGAVSHTAICEAVEKGGVRTVKQLQEKLNVANNCKKCAIAANVILKLALAAKAANKKAGIKGPIQLDLRTMLEAISAAEQAKRYNPTRTVQRRRRDTNNSDSSSTCTASTCTCGKVCG